ncbi:MAG TPA: hypothetical protein VN666_04465 [Nitrospira sp.]|nr:hypothetical protein [Nitrospira sp.]
MVDVELAKKARQILSQRKPDAHQIQVQKMAYEMPRSVQKATGQVDVVSVTPIIEPLSRPDGKPLLAIYWETGDGRILGPATPEFQAKTGNQFWIVTTFQGHIRWIDADRLRSKKSFETQRAIHEVELIRGF